VANRTFHFLGSTFLTSVVSAGTRILGFLLVALSRVGKAIFDGFTETSPRRSIDNTYPTSSGTGIFGRYFGPLSRMRESRFVEAFVNGPAGGHRRGSCTGSDETGTLGE